MQLLVSMVAVATDISWVLRPTMSGVSGRNSENGTLKLAYNDSRARNRHPACLNPNLVAALALDGAVLRPLSAEQMLQVPSHGGPIRVGDRVLGGVGDLTARQDAVVADAALESGADPFDRPA